MNVAVREMRATLHIGAPKTGSTAVQDMLDERRHELLERGLLVPVSGMLPTDMKVAGHHGLAFSAADQRYGVPYPGPWADLNAEIDASESNNVVISAEEFSLFTDDQVARVSEQIGHLDIRVVMYVRDLSAYLPSAYVQLIRSGGTASSFDAELPNLVAHADFDAMLRPWADVFGSDNVVVRSYDAAVDIRSDFLDVLGVEGLRVGSPCRRTNSAAPPVAVRVARLVNLVDHRIPDAFGVDLSRLRKRVLTSRRLPELAQRLMPWLDRPFWQAHHEALLDAPDSDRGHGRR